MKAFEWAERLSLNLLGSPPPKSPAQRVSVSRRYVVFSSYFRLHFHETKIASAPKESFSTE
jgi:hypothetical protein